MADENGVIVILKNHMILSNKKYINKENRGEFIK